MVSHAGRVPRWARGVLSLAAVASLSVSFLAMAPLAIAEEITIAIVRDGAGPEDLLVDLIETIHE